MGDAIASLAEAAHSLANFAANGNTTTITGRVPVPHMVASSVEPRGRAAHEPRSKRQKRAADADADALVDPELMAEDDDSRRGAAGRARKAAERRAPAKEKVLKADAKARALARRGHDASTSMSPPKPTRVPSSISQSPLLQQHLISDSQADTRLKLPALAPGQSQPPAHAPPPEQVTTHVLSSGEPLPPLSHAISREASQVPRQHRAGSAQRSRSSSLQAGGPGPGMNNHPWYSLQPPRGGDYDDPSGNNYSPEEVAVHQVLQSEVNRRAPRGRAPPALMNGGSNMNNGDASINPNLGGPSNNAFEPSVPAQADYSTDPNGAAYVPPPPVQHAGGGYKCTFEGCNAPPFSTQYLLKFVDGLEMLLTPSSHTKVHSHERPHFCDVQGCPRSEAGRTGEGGKGFKRKNEMVRHGLVHQSPGYRCPWCPDRGHPYPRPDNLQRHVKSHHRDKDKDDAELREILNQRLAPGSTRGRRRRG